MRQLIAAPLLLLVLAAMAISPASGQDPASGEDEARAAAERFGQALRQADPAMLKTVLPEKGKVQLRLDLLGPGDGFFSPNQVMALLRGFLEQGTVESFDLVRVEYDEKQALAFGRAELIDRSGRPARVDLQLAFQPEDGRWVLREIRETRS